MNTENSKINKHEFKLDLTDKINLKSPNKIMALANLSVYYTWKNIKSEQNNNKFKISARTWNDTFDLPEASYSIADIQDYFEFIIKKHETLTENPPTMKLLGSTKKTLIKIQTVKTYQNQNLLKLFQSIVTQPKMIINADQKFCLLLFQINNLVS